MKAKKKPLDEIDGSAATDKLGLEVVEYQLPKPRADVRIFDGSAQEAAKALLQALRDEAKVL